LVARFLVTTALEETWPEDPETPVLFLGEWCRLYSRKERWSRMKAEVLPYHWDDRNKLYEDYHYLQNYYERLLPEVGTTLNELHGVDHSTRYWRILIGPWLGYFLQMVFDRWTSIHNALIKYQLQETMVLDFSEASMIPQGMNDFSSFFLNDEWNHFIYSLILSHLDISVNKIKPKIIYNNNKELKQRYTETTRNLNYSKVYRFFQLISFIFGKNTDALFISTYYPYHLQWLLDLKLRQIPQLRLFLPTPISTIDFNCRNFRVAVDVRNDFENFILSIFPRQIPALYVEGYQKLIRQISNNKWPKKPRLIFTANGDHSDDHFMAYTAEKVQCGTPLVVAQHGGHFGIGKWYFMEDHQLAIADCFLSWGWTDSKRSHIRPIGMIKNYRPLKIQHSLQKRLLLVTQATPRYSYHMFSTTVAGQFLDYLEDQFKFCQHLSPELKSALKVKLYPHDFGWNQKERWTDRWPEIELAEDVSDVVNLIKKCRIYVSTYNATTYLESFSMNVPTVMFWNPNHWDLRNSAKPYFEALERAKVFHVTPQSAAQHVNLIWHDVDTWWTSNVVFDAVQNFCEQYSKMPENFLDEIHYNLKDLMNNN
jgi:putative transferase (TIGR04331 family)